MMLHFTCDMCGKDLLVNEDVRYVVKIEVYAAYDPMEITEEDLEKDHMEEISQLIEEMEDMDAEELEDGVYKSFRFDLCPMCQKKFIRNPLVRQPGTRLGFSEN